MGKQKPEKVTPAEAGTKAGAECRTRWGSLNANYPNLSSRAIQSYCVGPDLVIMGFAFAAEVMNG